MDPSQALDWAAVVSPLLGFPTVYAVIRYGKRQVVGTFHHAVVEVVDDRMPAIVKMEVAPLVDQITELADWRGRIEHELTPNSGSSMKDKLDALYEVVVDLKAATTVQRNMESAKADAFADGQYDPRAGQFT